MKKENYYFASANTGNGFVSHFDEISDNSKKSFQYIIKGGSGTGKSTLMKKVATHFADKGFSIEYFYCSTDTESLDGIRIVEKNISIVDGTAPHIINATLPSIKNKILDVGRFIGFGVKKHQKEIESIIQQKNLCFVDMYKYLGSAKILQQINVDIAKRNLTEKYINEQVQKICLKLPKSESDKPSERKLFLTSINNINNNLIKNNKFNKKILLLNENSEKIIIFNKLKEVLLNNNYNITTFRNCLNADYIDAILINKHNIIIINDKNIKNNNEIIEKNNKIIKNLINNAVNCINNSKTLHIELEKYYVASMDFEGVNIFTKNVINEIENFNF